ncbi:SDR family oxidoreductase [bacterium]|nr:SDR family oxidoreductase [bacterium]
MKKKVLITGITGSIGKVIAKTFIDNGYEVFGTGRNSNKIEKIKSELNIENIIKIDFLNTDFKPLLPDDFDILINCAGIYDYCETQKADEKKISEILKLNLEIPISLSKFVIPKIKEKKWGRIINIGSISGSVGEACAVAYSASKAGLIGLTKSLALELAFDNITVNCINPGWVDSDITNNFLSEDEKTETLDMIPQRRFIEPREIADLCLYLASDNAKGLTGQSINLCAGLSLG